jgi:hypothetical protein
MEYEDDPDFRRIQELLDADSYKPTLERLAEAFPKPGTPAFSGPSFDELTRQTSKRMVELVQQARRKQAVPTAANPAVPGPARIGLRDLKVESDLPWKTIAGDLHISGRRLHEIAAGARPSAETTKKLEEYFSKNLKRPVRL